MCLSSSDCHHHFNSSAGVASGAGVPFVSILAMNVRTEITYGMAIDGCTALSWITEDASFLAQNWDWQTEQAENLIHLTITRQSKPTIEMITEAGIIGKIGLSSSGVGVCLNAVRKQGIDFQKLPCHLALRACLDSTSKQEAVETLHKAGVAGSCHILVADETGGHGLECSYLLIVDLEPEAGVLLHTNHFIKRHSDRVLGTMHLPDSPVRYKRINDLIGMSQGKPTEQSIMDMLKDESGYPAAIWRAATDDSTVATLFRIIMDLREKVATVTFGRPSEGGETLILNPGRSISSGEK